jgi:branched-chain amino acid transport system ATP-binding protein
VAAQSKQQSLRLLDRIKPESKDDASKMLRDLNLTDLKDKHVSEVSHGNKKAIEIGMATLTEPELLLLDEPTSGVSGSESQSILEFISQISEQMTILFVEHDVDMVLDISDIITVFDHGKAIAEGSPEEIQENEQVQEAYLGGV